MKRFAKTIMFALILSVIPARIWAQDDMSNHAQTNIESHIRDYENGFLFNVFEIENVEERVQLASALATSDIWLCNPTENPGELFIRPNSYNADIPIYAEFEYLRMTLREEYQAASLLPKEEFTELFGSWAHNLSNEYYNFLMSDHLDRANHCMDAEPFCTTDVYNFPALNSGYSWSGPNYGCLNTSPTSHHSFWYYMRIGVAGNITIKIEANFDVDFALWGPFANETEPCPTSAGQAGLLTATCTNCPNNTSNSANYPYGNLHDCSFDARHYEYAHIVNGQVGQYFILLITNWSGTDGNITFQKYAGDGETDCGILPPLVNNEGPYCVGETIHLSAQGQAGATYSWTGPGNFSSNQQNPTRPNCTMAMAGTYTCTITVGTASNSATTEVVIYPQPTANFNYTSVCKGTPTQFTSTSTTNPSGQQIQSYQWTFGDGQTGSGQNVTHTYAQAGNYQVTLNVTTGNGHCTSSKTQTVPVYAAPVASATAQPSTVIYGGTATLTANAGATGTFNFHWEPANMVVNANAQTTQTVPLQATQTYTVTVTNPQGGCSSTAQVTVSMEGSNMTAMASADQYELCEGESTTLHAQPSGGTGNYTFNWTPANTLSNATIQNPVATPPVGETTYTCAVSDGITNQNVSVTIMVHPNEVEEVEHTICENDIYDFYGESVHTPGIYEHHTQTEFGCDKLIRLHLYNWDTYETPISDHFCQGEHYMFFDQALDASGTYYHTLESAHGCDSVIKLNLIQDPSYEVELWESTCQGGPGYYFAPLDIYLPPSPYPNAFVFETVQGCDSVVYLTVEEAEYNSKTYNVSLCATEYTWPSNGRTYYETGTFYDTLSFPNACDSTLVLNLELRPSYDIEVHETSCDSYRWKNDTYNVDMTFNESTVYTHHYVNAYGCDSQATLYLTIDDHNEVSFTVTDEENCDSYYWDPQGHEILYTDHEDLEYNMSGTYHRTYKNIYDCDSLVTMNVQFEYTPHPTEIYPMDATNSAPHWVITATEFQINAYDFNMWDTNPNCHWDSVTWNFTKPVDWVLEPFGTNNQCCKMYVLSWVEDTVWLEAHAFNRCAPQEGTTQRYWFLSSFIGIDENSPSTGLETIDFDVIPNPNNGKMQLNLEHLTGKVGIKVYDMKGTLIDQFETYNNGSGTYDYNMKVKSDGIYFFVATNKEGTIAKKVVIQK